MSNVLVGYEDAVDSRITDKVDDYSISKDDVSGSLKELADLALLYPQSNITLTYPKDFITRDAGYNLFIALADDVNGDTTNGANWQPLSSNVAQSVYDLGIISDDFANGYNATVPSIVAYSTSNIYLFKPDTTNTGASTLQINALSTLPIKKYSYSAIVDVVLGDLDSANTYLLIYKTTYFLIASSGSSSGGGSGTSLTDTITAGENLVENDLVYLKSDGKYWKADYLTTATCSTELRLVTDATITANTSGESLIIGLKYGFTGLTAGELYYVGADGAICLYSDIPDTEGIIVRSIGTAKSTTELEFNPDETYIETTLVSTIQTGILRVVENRAGVTATLGAALLTDYVENCTGTNVLTLQTAVGNTNKYTITVISGSTTINTTGGQTINGSSSIVINTPYTSRDFISDGTNWIIR